MKHERDRSDQEMAELRYQVRTAEQRLTALERLLQNVRTALGDETDVEHWKAQSQEWRSRYDEVARQLLQTGLEAPR